MADDEVLYFATPVAWRGWLEKHHEKAKELWVGFHKRGSGKPSITWPESVDEALCFGWIDGVRKSIDETRYKIRFSPRKPTSTWSSVNIKRVAELTELGRMRPAGLAAFERRSAKKSGIYAYEQRHEIALDPAYEKKLRANKKAWAFFTSSAPYYQRICVYWIMTAKQEPTRLRRLARLIEDSAAGRKVGIMGAPDPR
jgi:uncharacterized protein YdeI (YjbR/CyaY-like superfamily)